MKLKSALKNNQFILHYQPIIHLETGEIKEVEALIRWQHPIDGLLGPDLFLGLCKKTNFIIALGEWMLRTACLHFKKMKLRFPRLV